MGWKRPVAAGIFWAAFAVYATLEYEFPRWWLRVIFGAVAALLADLD